MPYEITQRPAEVTFPPLPQPKLVLDLATPLNMLLIKATYLLTYFRSLSLRREVVYL